jgi:UDP-4-amino-4,6-dideoxy-N-acetyl-beta-L-altrosamine N-acetyltransferase
MLIPLNESTYKNILEWRNNPLVRANSTTSHVISEKEHEQWWNKVRQDNSQEWMLFKYKEFACGVVHFIDIVPEKIAYWGFYLSNDLESYQVLGAWFSLEKEALEYAFQTLKLQQLNCKVFRFNRAALQMHKRFNYQELTVDEHPKGELITLQLKKNNWKKNG